MATVGNTATPNFGVAWDGTAGAKNAVWTSYTMPAGGGLITDLHAYFDGQNNGSGTGYLFLGDASGNLLASVNIGTIPQGSDTAGAQAWHSGTLATPFWVAGGTGIVIGFEITQSSGAVWSFNSSGASGWQSLSSIPASVTAGSATGHGSTGSYADYTPLSAHILRSGAWAQASGVSVLRGGVWTTLQELAIERSSAWAPTQ